MALTSKISFLPRFQERLRIPLKQLNHVPENRTGH